MPLILVSKEPKSTQLPELEGRLFYVLFTYLQGKAYNSVINDSAKSNYKKWDYYDVQKNSFDLRNMVSRRVFDEYETLLDGLRNLTPWDKQLLKNISLGGLGTAFHKFAESHMEIFNKWKDIRFEGQFWYLGSCSEGGVFVYLGNSEEDERIFIVKALANPFSHLLGQKMGELPGFCFETVLLNWKDVIIYHGIISPYTGYSPKEYIQRHERLTGIIGRCENKNKVRYTLQADDNVLVDRRRFGVNGEMFSDFMKTFPVVNKNSEVSMEFYAVTFIWTPTEDSTTRMTFEELTEVLQSGKTDGFKQSIARSILVKSGEKCTFCPTGIFGICPCKEYHRTFSMSNAKSLYCMDGISVEQARTKTPPYEVEKYSLMDFYNFQFVVTREQFAEIIIRLEECSLFFHGDNNPEKESAFFHYVGPVVLLQEAGSCCVMTFGSIEMFYKENRIEICNNSLTRAMNMLNVTRFIILGSCDYGNQQKIDVDDMQIDVTLCSNIKNASKVRQNASELAKKFEEFIGGAVTIQIDKKTFDHRSCSYCRIGYQEKKLFFCKPCKEKKRNIMYCSRECQKSHWQYHKVTCKN